MRVLRALLLRLFRALSGVFFRDVEVVGAPPADTRGRLFAANHVNGLIDPILVVTSAPFPIAPVAKAPLFRVPVLRTLLRIVDAVPVVRKQDAPGRPAEANEAVFDRVADHFARGGNVLIFPEGVSHSEPHVVPLKTGPARMLARAKARGVQGLTFQAIALEFDARETFRSRALVMFGPVRSVDELGLEGDALVSAITARLAEDLSDLVVEGRTWDERKLIARVAELLAHDEGDRSLATWSSIGRQAAAARRTLGDRSHPLYAEVEGAVTAYYDLLARSGVHEDEVVAGVPPRPGATLRAIVLIALLPLAIVGAVLYAVPYQVPKLAHRLAGKERDVVSTYKLALGLIVHPIWMASLIVLSLLRLDPPWSIVGAALALISPFAAMAFLDRAQTLAARWASLPFVARGRLDELRAARKNAISAIERARAALGT